MPVEQRDGVGEAQSYPWLSLLHPRGGCGKRQEKELLRAWQQGVRHCQTSLLQIMHRLKGHGKQRTQRGKEAQGRGIWVFLGARTRSHFPELISDTSQ